MPLATNAASHFHAIGEKNIINDISREIIHDIVLIFRCALISSISYDFRIFISKNSNNFKYRNCLHEIGF